MRVGPSEQQDTVVIHLFHATRVHGGPPRKSRTSSCHKVHGSSQPEWPTIHISRQSPSICSNHSPPRAAFYI